MGVRYHSERQCTRVRISSLLVVPRPAAAARVTASNSEPRGRFTRLLASMMPARRRYVSTAYERPRCARLRTDDGDFDVSGPFDTHHAAGAMLHSASRRAAANARTGVSTKEGRGPEAPLPTPRRRGARRFAYAGRRGVAPSSVTLRSRPAVPAATRPTPPPLALPSDPPARATRARRKWPPGENRARLPRTAPPPPPCRW